MSRIKTSATTTSSESSTSLTPSAIQSAIGDHILIHALADTTSGGDIAIPTGYTQIGNQVSSGCTVAIFVKKTTVTNEPMPILEKVATTSTLWMASVLIIEDADDNFLNVFNSTTEGAAIKLVPSGTVTTTSDNCLIIRCFGTNQITAAEPVNGVGDVIYETGQAYNGLATLKIDYNNQATAGTSKLINYARGGGGTAIVTTIAINNKVGGQLECDVDSGLEYIHIHGYPQTTTVGGAGLTTTTVAPTTILGETLTNVGAVLSVANDSFDVVSTFTRIQCTGVPATGWFGFAFEMPQTNLLDELVTLSYKSTSGSWGLRMLIYFEDSIGNYAFIETPFAQPITKIGVYSSLPLIEGSVTPIDWTTVVKYGICILKGNTSTSNRNIDLKDFAIAKNSTSLRLFGGGVTGRTIAKAMRSSFDIDRSLSQGLSQDVVTVPFRIGNGVDKTTFTHGGASIETPSSLTGWDVGKNTIDFIVNASPTCIMDFSAGILANSVEQNFIIDPSSSLLATYNFSTIFNNFRITWLKGVECRGATFLRCGVIDTNGSDFVNCSFADSTEPRGILLYNDGNVTGCSFTKGGDDYAIEISEAGTYDLSNTEFNGYTTDINVTATTGIVVLALGIGQVAPTFITAGASVQLPFDSALDFPVAASSWEVYPSAADVRVGTNLIATGTSADNYEFDFGNQTFHYIMQIGTASVIDSITVTAVGITPIPLDQTVLLSSINATTDIINNKLGYIAPVVYCNPLNPINGDGKAETPFNNMADAVISSQDLNAKTIELLNSSELTTPTNGVNIESIKESIFLNLNGQDIDGTLLSKMIIYGSCVTSNGAHIKDSIVGFPQLGGVTGFTGIIQSFILKGSLSITGNTSLVNGGTEQHEQVTINVGVGANLSMSQITGRLLITGLQAGSVVDATLQTGEIEVDPTCLDGIIYVKGHAQIINNSGGAVVIDRTDEALYLESLQDVNLIEDDGLDKRFTLNALEQAPSGGGGGGGSYDDTVLIDKIDIIDANVDAIKLITDGLVNYDDTIINNKLDAIPTTDSVADISGLETKIEADTRQALLIAEHIQTQTDISNISGYDESNVVSKLDTLQLGVTSIKPDLTIINNNVKKSSLIIPTNEDLT